MTTLDGHVLTGPRIATSNSPLTSAPDGGVSRQVGPLPSDYPTGSPTWVEGRADQYRTVVNGPLGEVEYLVWAANTANLAQVPAQEWLSENLSIPTDSLEVLDPASPTGKRTDGSQRVVLTDPQGRSLGTIASATFRRGGTTGNVVLALNTDFTFDAVSGVLTILNTGSMQSVCQVPVGAPAAVSSARGDTFRVAYTLSDARFWWTRNDRYQTRFGWNGASGRWEPYKGGAPTRLGVLEQGQVLSPVPASTGFLPGTFAGDGYALLRLGALPNATSYAIVQRTSGPFNGVLVVSEDLASADYNFGSTSPALAGVMGAQSGTLFWNPAFLAAHAGEILWYSPREFRADADGVVGLLTDTNLYLAPIPAPGERPILRLGNRQPLTVAIVDTETQLAALSVPAGTAAMALSTGRLKFDPSDVTRATPGTRDVPNASFDPLYLNVQVLYGGVTMNSLPQPIRAPQALVNGSGSVAAFDGSPLYIPDAVDFLGLSGVLTVPDGTGSVPNPAAAVGPRPGASGLVRRLSSYGDVLLYSASGVVTRVVVVDFEDELPTDIYRIPAGTAYVALEKHSGSTGSRVVFGADVYAMFLAQTVYFQQAEFLPSRVSPTATLVSQVRDSFVLTGSERLRFRLGSTSLTWMAPGAGTYTADAIATSITTAIGVAPGTCTVKQGHLILAGTSLVSVGFGVGGEEDLSGCTALGFLPGWLARDSSAWCADAGLGFGLFRSPANLNGQGTTPDIRDLYRVRDQILSSSLQAQPYQFLNQIPREDVAGYDLGAFFLLNAQGRPGAAPIIGQPLRPFRDVSYRFGSRQFGWLSQGELSGEVRSPVSSIDLEVAQVEPASLLAPMGGYLKVAADGGEFNFLDPGTDVLVEGSKAVLIRTVGARILGGSQGHTTLGGSVLTDNSVTFTSIVHAEDRLKILTTEDVGSYTVTAVGTNTLTVTPAFAHGDGGGVVAWEVTAGVAAGTVDPAVLASVVYQEFDPYLSQPFVVNVLSLLGVAGATLARANTAAALDSGRSLAIRFSQDGTDIPLTVLGPTVLGTLANGSLTVPHTGADAARFNAGAFNLLVGTELFEHGSTLLGVTSFSSNPAYVEYITTGGSMGALKFGTSVLAALEGSPVSVIPTPQPAAGIPTGTAEVDPSTGTVRLSQVDLTANAGEKVYLVESMVPGTDVVLNPIAGAFGFLQPIRNGQLVEATYYRAMAGTGAQLLVDGSPVQVKEFLPVFIRRELATRESDQVYVFNPDGRTVDPTVAPQVMVDEFMASYGVPSGVNVDFANSRLSLVDPAAETANVRVSYATLEAVGGETSYTVSQGPVWRPPLYLPARATNFSLTGNRTADMVPGKILRLGTFVTYLTASTYANGVTTVTVSPASPTGAGSLAPGEDALCLLTDRPVHPPSMTPAQQAFLPTLNAAYGLSAVPQFDPLVPGQNRVRLEGDLRKYGVVGHILEVSGRPYSIVKVDLDEEGRWTTFTLGSPLQVSLTWSSGLPATTFRISAHPIYPEGAMDFLGSAAFLDSRPYELVLYEGSAPGQTLEPGTDYTIDTGSGNISLRTLTHTGLAAGSSLRFYRTDIITLAPFVAQGQVVRPRVKAAFSYLDAPSVANGRLGSTLLGRYSFESPDSFYLRATTLSTYASEVVGTLTAPPQPVATGPITTTASRTLSSAQGRMGLEAERRELLAQDRVARAYLNYYNGITSSFEQILETLTGQPVGDRDGKFRSWIGRANQWVPPGYEDPITGEINPRVLWFEAWAGLRGASTPIPLLTHDPVISPLGATTDGKGRPSGAYQDPAGFTSLLEMQRRRIKNDLDDVVLVGRTRVTRTLTGFITFSVVGYGEFRPLSQPSAFSRIFPERTTAFTTLGPGVDGSPGEYTAGRIVFSPEVAYLSTQGEVIGRLENPVLGPLENVQGMQARDRLARARIWAYGPAGFPTVDAGTTDRPTILATVRPLDQFPTRFDTGLPDTSRLASQSGGLVPSGIPDLATGDPDLHTPPFRSGDQVALGYPDGSIRTLGYTGTLLPMPSGEMGYAGVFVDQVLVGAALTFKSLDLAGADVPITNPNTLVVLTGLTTGTPLDAEQGQTILVVPTSGAPITASDPPTAEELTLYTRALPSYRTGTDLNFRARTGELLDATLPSFSDPTLFGIREITGQRPPAPLSTLEARVDFQNGSVLPLAIPALEGETRLDSGDFSLPYLVLVGAELPILGVVADDLSRILYLDSPTSVPSAPTGVDPYAVEAVYPDEIVGTGSVASGFLSTTTDLDPSTVVYPSPGHQGVGALKSYDYLLVQEGSGGAAPAGSTGILQVGAVAHASTSTVEPPRFTSATNLGTKTNFRIDNVQTVIDASGTTGMVVTQDTNVPGDVVTYFDLVGVSTSSIVFDDGVGGGSLPTPVGGYNTLLSNSAAGTLFEMRVLSSAGAIVTSAILIIRVVTPGADILATVFEISGDNGSTFEPVLAGGLWFSSQQITVHTGTPIFYFSPYAFSIPGPGLLRTDGYLGTLFSVQGVESTSVRIEDDRLTLNLPVDCRTAQARGALTPGGSSMECSLSVAETEAALYSSATLGFVPVMTLMNGTGVVNGGSPFTMLTRAAVTPSVYGIGTFIASRGRLKVMAWEGHNNTAIAGTNLLFSAMPTSRQDEVGPIFEGVALSDKVTNPSSVAFDANRFVPTSALTGAVGNVQVGDLLVVKAVSGDPAYPNPKASGKAGTYPIRGVMIANTGTTERRETFVSTAGDDHGWMGLAFPTVVSIVDGSGPNLTVSEIVNTLPNVQDYGGTPLSLAQVFMPLSGRVFVIVNEQALASTNSAVYATAVCSATYASIFGNIFIDLSDFKDGIGNTITKAAFLAQVQAGRKVSGMTRAPVRPVSLGLPADLPGTTTPTASFGNRAFFGFRRIDITRGATTETFQAASSGDIVSDITLGSKFTVYARIQETPGTLHLPNQALYPNIPGVLDLMAVDWDGVHTTGAFVPAGTRCILPGDLFSLVYSGQAGIYVEPSAPRSINNLAAARVNVVNALHSLTSGEVGTPRLADYLASPSSVPAAGYLEEYVQCEVRRPRRWHEVQTQASTKLQDLRFAYEIRRGIVATVTTTSGVCTLTADPVDGSYIPSAMGGGTATQLGNFTDDRLNVQAGDLVRFLNSSGDVIEESEVRAITGDLTLGLSRINLTVAPGTRFEVFLRTPLIPQEQSGEELLTLVTEQVLVSRKANYTTQQGGQVTYVPNADPQVAYNQSANKLSDTDSSVNFSSVQEGDYVLVDPAGAVAGPTGVASPAEKGMGPRGDNGVITRGASYTAGSPSRVDDNRGYYRVAESTSSLVTVSASENLLAGDRVTGDKILGTGISTYAVYPTVHGSNLSGSGNGTEGQMDLRPTALAGGGNSFAGTWRSVAPFSYRIIRPQSNLSVETIELVLATRERMLSWMDQLRQVFGYSYGGTYYDFQRDDHLADLGTATDPGQSQGLMRNLILDGLIGRVRVTPFVNNSTCLSILDRRFWGLDLRLLTLHPFDDTTPYADYNNGVGRPVLPDRIQQALDQRDRIRPTRLAWLTIRAHRSTGTLERVRQFDREIPSRRAEQERSLLAALSAETTRE